MEEGEQRLTTARQARVDRLAEQERQRRAELERQRIANAINEYWTALETAIESEDLDEATTILNHVRTLNPEAAELAQGELRLEPLRAELERQRVEAIQEHWKAFEVRLEAEDLSEAASILAEVRALNPEDQGLEAGEQRLEAAKKQQVIKEYWVVFEAALGMRDMNKAASTLIQISELYPDLAGLSAGEQRLERMRQESEERARESVGEMVSIPGGTFSMGDLSGDGNDNERPVHNITVPSFRIGKYEVTFAQWYVCVADGGCGGYTPDDEGWGRGDRPVINVSWDDAQGFIDWLNNRTGGNFRLPTEAEWEYAARAGSTKKYSWGNSIGSNRANCVEDEFGHVCGERWKYTSPAGSFSANAWGLHDFHGNVFEWVQDCYTNSYVGAPADGSAWTSGNCSWRVIRGGSWVGYASSLRSAYRVSESRSVRDDSTGFRLAQDK